MNTQEAIVQANNLLRIECDNLTRENQELKEELRQVLRKQIKIQNQGKRTR